MNPSPQSSESIHQQDLPLVERKVLIVDDDEDVLFSLQTLLEHSGWKVESASDGSIAMRRLLTTGNLPDVILLDYEMPHENGIRFWNELNDHQELCFIPTIMMSGTRIPITDIPGIKGIVAKPINTPELLSLLERSLIKSDI